MEQKNFEYERDSFYRLISVTDENGRDKSQDRSFYENRVGCIATDFHYDNFPSHGGKYRLNMKFVQNERGEWIKRGLHTSAVYEVEETENGFKLHTHYSVYTFENAQLNEVPLQEATELIELYLSIDDGYYFGKGFYYDETGKVYELTDDIHVGTFQDSVLIRILEHDTLNGHICRYFPHFSSVEFYNSLSVKHNYSIPMLIHNTGNDDLVVKRDRAPYTWTIKPGESKKIILNKALGADKEEDEDNSVREVRS